MSKKHSQILLAVAVLAALFFALRKKPCVSSTFTAGTPVDPTSAIEGSLTNQAMAGLGIG